MSIPDPDTEVDDDVAQLRPESLEEFSGQPQVVAQVELLLDAAKARGELTDHVLLSGPPGLGKTTLAQIVANELGVPIVTTSGPALDKPGDLAALLTNLPDRCVVFIDEIHRMQRKIEELLYSAMEDGVMDVRIGDGADGRVLRVPLAEFTLVGATTQLGLLSAPLRDRFGYTARMALYSDEALAEIARRSARVLGVNLTVDGAVALASRSRGTPRVANMWLSRVRDWAQVNDIDPVDTDTVVAALDAFDVDTIGLDDLGQDILRSLCVAFRGGPVGLSTLAAAVGEATSTVSDVYEPFLLRRGLLQRTPRGRVATPSAFEHLGLDVPVTLLAGGRDEEPQLFDGSA